MLTFVSFKILSNIQSLAAFFLGITAGILGLRSSAGFVFYLLGTCFVSLLFHVFLVKLGPRSRSVSAESGAGAFFPGSGPAVQDYADKNAQEYNGKNSNRGAWKDIWLGGGVLGEALSGFVLGWAGVGGVLR